MSSDPRNSDSDAQEADVQASSPSAVGGEASVDHEVTGGAVAPDDQELSTEEVVEQTADEPQAAERDEPSDGPEMTPAAKVVEDDDMDVEPIELLAEEMGEDESLETKWYILKVQVNREDSIRDALERRVKLEGLESYFEQIIVPTEDVAEFTKSGKRRIVKRKLYPGYIMVKMAINDDTWFAVRETPGIGDFTGSAGKPTPMEPHDVERILRSDADEEDEASQVKTSIPFVVGDRVRVKEGNFQNFEGDVDKIDEAHGLITVVIPIFNRPTPVEIPYWQIEKV